MSELTTQLSGQDNVTGEAPRAIPEGKQETAKSPSTLPTRDARPDEKPSLGPPAIKARSVSSLPDDLGPEDFAAAIEETVLEFKEGDIIEGTVVNMEQDEVLVDIGYKSEGVVPRKELSIRKNVAPSEIVSIGEQIEVLVLEKEDEEGRLILSKKRALYERVWGQIEAVREQGGTVKGTVIEVVKGGLIVDIGLRGFLPASLVDLRRVRDLEPFIGEEIEAKVIELDRNRNNVVLSRRAYLEEAQAEQRNAFLDALVEGEVQTGVVSSVVNFGAFVDLGGMDGLVHVSELSWQHVNHPSEVVKVGQEVTVKVLDIDRNRERISLSIKQTSTDPWQEFSSEHEVGAIVEGKVIKTVPFGAFVGVDNGVEGLVHVSEIAMHRVESPELELSIGQNVMVKLTEMDEARRRVSFSIKQALPEFSARKAGPRPPRRRTSAVSEFERADKKEETRTFDVDSSLEAILQELKERGIGRR
jgi:small subunit ribosomal protein S1